MKQKNKKDLEDREEVRSYIIKKGDMIVDQYLQDVFQINFVPCSIVFFLMLFMLFNKPYEADLVKRFMLPTILLVLLIIVDNFDYLLFDHGDTSYVHVTTAILGYNIRIFILICLIFISVRKNRIKHTALVLVPAIVNIFVCILAHFTHLVFWYNEDGVVVRGPLAYWPHITFLVYILMFLTIAWMKLKRGKHNEGVYLVCAIVLSGIAVAVETILQLRGILMGIIALDIFCYYLYFHIEHYKFDPITDIFNRDSFEAAIQKPEKISAVISIDMNNLKDLNDKFGHLYGDKALCVTAEAISISLPKRCSAYRIGGDEFAVLAFGPFDKLKQVCDKIKYNVIEAGCTVACGGTYTKDYASFTEAYKEADELMYIEKSRMKRLNGVYSYSTEQD